MSRILDIPLYKASIEDVAAYFNTTPEIVRSAITNKHAETFADVWEFIQDIRQQGKKVLPILTPFQRINKQ